MAITTAVAAVASAAIGAASAVSAGRAQSRAAAFEQQQLNIQAEQQKAAAMQSEAARREELVSSLQTIQALRSGRGVGLGSPTGTAILQSLADQEERDILTERSNFLLNADRSRMAASEAGRRRRSSLMSGYLGAAGSIAGGAVGVAGSGAFGGSGSTGYGATGRGLVIRGSNGMMGGGV